MLEKTYLLSVQALPHCSHREITKDNFAAVQNTYDLVPRRPVRLDFKKFWTSQFRFISSDAE